MITRRDNLLIRPWQQKIYENHRKKVLTALPAIDNSTPPNRIHVSNKWKKQQRETERIRSIERDNFLLLKKLNHIMKTSRVDNWLPPQPSFLNRLGMYADPNEFRESTYSKETITQPEKLRSRKARCPACTPQKTEKIKFPEERIPWEPMKKPIGRSARSRSVPPKKSQPLPTINEKPIPTSANAEIRTIDSDVSMQKHSEDETEAESIKRTAKTATVLPKANRDAADDVSFRKQVHDEKKTKNVKKGTFALWEPQRIVLSRGCLKLCVNFPADTLVKFQDRNAEKCVVSRDLCHCKSLSAAGKVF